MGSYPTLSPLPRRHCGSLPRDPRHDEPNCRRGGLLSVALSLGSPPPDVIRHRLSVEPGLSSPAVFRRLTGAVARPADGASVGQAGALVNRRGTAVHRSSCAEGRRTRPSEPRRRRAPPPRSAPHAVAATRPEPGAASPASSAVSVSMVETSATPSTRPGRK
ncbi:hypothetical protein ATO4_04812 [Aurantimonas sp. 22II-16-19i]|nr:hypothetical protein ATO4_04812 [Aurantimonas sp. 22II-16-19i]